jgi:hypothetical protein
MTQVILHKILAQLPELEIEELQELNQVIGQYLAAKTTTTEQTVFYQALLDSGLVKQIKYPPFLPSRLSNSSRLYRI